MVINRLAIIGLGSIGKRHLRLVSEIRPDIEIIVVRSGQGNPCQEENMAKKTEKNIYMVIYGYIRLYTAIYGYIYIYIYIWLYIYL